MTRWSSYGSSPTSVPMLTVGVAGIVHAAELRARSFSTIVRPALSRIVVTGELPRSPDAQAVSQRMPTMARRQACDGRLSTGSPLPWYAGKVQGRAGGRQSLRGNGNGKLNWEEPDGSHRMPERHAQLRRTRREPQAASR